DHLAGLALAELQGGGSRPAVHTAVALVAELFGAGLDAIALLGCAPVASHPLGPRGEQAGPQGELAVDPRLWSALRGGALEWTACHAIDPGEGELVPELVTGALPYLAALLRTGDAGTAVLRGTPRSGRAGAAALLARQLGRRAL